MADLQQYQEEPHFDIESLLTSPTERVKGAFNTLESDKLDRTIEDSGAGGITSVVNRLGSMGQIPNLDYASMPESKNIEDRTKEKPYVPRKVGEGGQLRASASDLFFGENRYKTWPERAILGLIDTLKIPGEVAKGNIDMNSTEGIEKATDLALATMMGGVFGVGKQTAKAGFMEKYTNTL